MSVNRDQLATSHTTSERNLEYIQRKINAFKDYTINNRRIVNEKINL